MSIYPTAFQLFRLDLPSWITEYLIQQPETYPTPEDPMELVTTLTLLTIQYGTGGFPVRHPTIGRAGCESRPLVNEPNHPC